MKQDLNNLFKIIIKETNKNEEKNLIVKTLIVQKLLIKYKPLRKWTRIYTELNLGKRVCNIYFENLKTKEVYIYEIKKDISKEWLDETKKFYENYKVYDMDFNLIIINLDKYSNNLSKLNKELDRVMM